MSASPFDGPDPPVPETVIHFVTLPSDTQRLLLRAAQLLAAIDFGSVILTVHDGRVVQVELSEKIRLT